jgi:exodeoxyribonuclease III
MKLVSYNLNGIRSASSKGLADWLTQEQPDIVAFQELKAQPAQVPIELFTAAGYTHCHWHAAQKLGYSGVGIISKIAPDYVEAGCGIAEYDNEGRVLRADFGDITVLSVYFPSGTSGDVRQEVKYRFLADIMLWVENLRKTRPNIILMGDYNIAHAEIDIHSPKTNKKTSGFLPEEREWMTAWFAAGFTDAFRHCNPALQTYSWWSTRSNARATDKGWRIDYVSVADSLKARLVSARHANEAVHSDHCPVVVEMNW